MKLFGWLTRVQLSKLDLTDSSNFKKMESSFREFSVKQAKKERYSHSA